jgi:type VI secretion system secreted protein Hcp
MAHEFYVTIEGSAQNAFKGESLVTAQAEKITGLSYLHQVSAPRDIATGLPSGRRQHGPITITKEWGASSPQILQALVTNEILKKVLFEFYQTTREGKLEKYYTVELTNATISNIKYLTGSGGDASASSAKTSAQYDTHELEEVSFTYQKISVSHVTASTATTDDWTSPA